MLSTCAKLLQWHWYFGICSTQVPHTFGLPTTAITCVFVKQQTPKKRSNTRLYTGWRFDCFYALILCQTASITEVFWSMLYTGTPHIFGLGTTTNTCVFVKEQTPKKRSNTRLHTRARDSTACMLSTCAKLLQWHWYFGICSTQVPHTFGLPTTAITCVFVKQQTPKKRSNTRLYTGWRFDCFYALILCQTASITEVFWSMLYTGTPHIFGLGTTTNTCVFVKEQTPKKRSNTRLYTRAGDSTAFMLSTCAKLLRWWYFGLCSTQVPHTYSVSQLLPSHVYLSSNGHPRIAEIDVCTPGLEIRLLLCSELVPNCWNDGCILDYPVHRYHTHIRSPKYSRRMCIGPEIVIQKSLKLTFIHSG